MAYAYGAAAPSNPPMANPIAVVSPHFCAPYPVDLIIAKKLMTLSEGSFAVTDVNGAVMFKIITAHRRWQVYRGDSSDSKDLVFSVKKSSVLQFKTELDVFLGTNTKEDVPDFKVKGVTTSQLEFLSKRGLAILETELGVDMIVIWELPSGLDYHSIRLLLGLETADISGSNFESSTLFASIPLQPVPRLSFQGGAPGYSGPIERGFMSGPIERGFTSGPIDEEQIKEEKDDNKVMKFKVSEKPEKQSFIKILKRAISGGLARSRGKNNKSIVAPIKGGVDSDEKKKIVVVEEENNVGKAGEDRVHIVISEEHGWVFVGIYDGFNGPDAPDYLLTNLYPNVHKELKGLLWNEEKFQSLSNSNNSELDMKKQGKRWKGEWNRERLEVDKKMKENFNGGEKNVLKALSEALKKTEDSYLDIADKMVMENPELALMGSCVLVMLMKGEDVYLMNLTMDHSTYVKEEVERIKKEHPDDVCAVMNERVKGYLKVTRAFGAGFLKQPKWNDALLEMFRINYVGSCPYITCLPSVYHHRLSSRDRFLILSSDGLYQYFTNEEAVSEVEFFIASFPDGDPAQHLIQEVLFRAARKAGMDFHELLDIPQGERRRYHDDISIIVISLEGRIWRSSV
uniref:PPM-type phosphatase domain-containing protein n=1 Tax=Cannabis sativa TaxID=3483 RepID=A0A803QFA7_CANSA